MVHCYYYFCMPHVYVNVAAVLLVAGWRNCCWLIESVFLFIFTQNIFFSSALLCRNDGFVVPTSSPAISGMRGAARGCQPAAAKPPRVRVYVYAPNASFLPMAMHFSCGRGSFVALSAAGHARGGTCTRRCKLEPRPDSVERALGVQGRGELALFAGCLSAHLEPSKSVETSYLVFSF